MCLRRRFKKNENTSVAAGAKELVLDLEERCCIRQLTVVIDMNDTTGTTKSRLILKVDEDTILNENIWTLRWYYTGVPVAADASRPINLLTYDTSGKRFDFVFLDLGRVERRFAIFFENKDTSNPATVYCGVIYDILED